MNQTPKISMIMSVYNGQDYLEEAIDSVLQQSLQDWELIVINDCSTDNTSEILERYAAKDSRIRVYTNDVNLRLPASLNKAMSYASGKYIARMDADDICLPDRLEKQCAFMEGHPDVALSSCRFLTLKNGVIASGGGGGRCGSASLKSRLLVTNPILHPGVIAKTEVIRSLGYDPRFTCTEDLELWTRFVMNGHKVQIQPAYLMIYRLHDKQITATTLERQHQEVLKIQKTYYTKFLQPMTPDQEQFYITGIYFRENIDTDQFCRFNRWLRSANRKTRAFTPGSVCYAMLDILAEYKRKGISKAELTKCLLSFAPFSLFREIMVRKQRAWLDGYRCIEAAKKIGLKKTGGTLAYPFFQNEDIGV